MKIGILGGGIAGLSLAYFLKEKSVIFEREKNIGGLGRSFGLNGIHYDIGPHIIFSKNKEIVNLHASLTETNEIRRSNKIFHKGRLVKYPFENDLAALEKNDMEYCLKEFLNNPYENYEAKNMLQFFLKTFGEGITRLYLQPYNEKIWKLDPAFMDVQMVERIPKPPKEDVIKSAEGISTEGYQHQLYFRYPKKGGFQSLVNAYAGLIREKSEIIYPVKITEISKNNGKWSLKTDKGDFEFSTLVNCMPLHELFRYVEAPKIVLEALNGLKYNSIYIVVLQAKKDNIGENFSLNFADKDIIFHRISKLNFLGEEYCLSGNSPTFLAEVTYRPGSYLAGLGQEEVKRRVVSDLDRLNLVAKGDITDIEARSFEYAYPIYDLNHRKNTDVVLDYLKGLGIHCCGRFAEFEYINSDKVVENAQNLAKKLNSSTNAQ